MASCPVCKRTVAFPKVEKHLQRHEKAGEFLDEEDEHTQEFFDVWDRYKRAQVLREATDARFRRTAGKKVPDKDDTPPNSSGDPEQNERARAVRMFETLRQYLPEEVASFLSPYIASRVFLAKVLAWFVACYVALHVEVGVLFFIATGFLVVFMNLGERDKSLRSAYSVYNHDGKALPGQYTSESFERALGVRRVDDM
eukprot:TRINITY_DN1484_c0_g1_i2.p2 TRINITY_DN1484_c0_g1~~TRINITY_DN1484_c0_g1_i2.p2  ORF type:complete len:198 (-),score=53.30 TRINITY_DN1484_c0_g1_i2:1159-1752(-)